MVRGEDYGLARFVAIDGSKLDFVYNFEGTCNVVHNFAG